MAAFARWHREYYPDAAAIPEARMSATPPDIDSSASPSSASATSATCRWRWSSAAIRHARFRHRSQAHLQNSAPGRDHTSGNRARGAGRGDAWPAARPTDPAHALTGCNIFVVPSTCAPVDRRTDFGPLESAERGIGRALQAQRCRGVRKHGVPGTAREICVPVLEP
ncbi:MAG: hypothetical protein U1F20_03865 [Lysobacterales bacterium]